MISTTSFSNRNNFTSLCKNLLKRNIGAMVYLTVLGFVFFPLQFILTAYSYNFDNTMRFADSMDVFARTTGGHTVVSVVFFTMIMIITPVVVGLTQMSYLHSKRAVDVYHSLPVTRDSLMAANFCVGFVTIMLPAFINYLATIGVGALKAATTIYTFNPLPLITDFGIWAIIVLAILGVISFVSVQVGSVFDNFVFAGELILAPAAVLFLAVWILDMFLLGFSVQNINMENLTLYSPISLIIARYAMGDSNNYHPFIRNSNIALVIWLGIALLLFSCAVLIYRKRKSELAEKNISASPIAQVGKLIAVYLGGILIGVMFYALFSADETYLFPLWSLLGAALVYVLSEVILLRGFKGLSKSLVPGVVSVALVGVFAFAAVGGGFGYVNKIPTASSVESVTINYRGRYGDLRQVVGSSKQLANQSWWEDGEQKASVYYDYDYYDDVTLTSPEAIALILEYHQAIIDYNKAPKEDEEYRDYTYMNHTISYAIKGGKKMVRTYNNSDIPGSAKAILAKLEGTEEFKRKTHPVFNSTAEDYSSMVVTDAFGINSGTPITDQAKIAQVLQALADDMLDEDINRVMSGEAKVLGYVDFAMKKSPVETGTEKDDFLSNYVIITEDYKRTVGLLRSMGQEELLTADTSEITQVGVTTNLYHGYGESVIYKVPFKEYILDRESISEKFYGQPDYTSDDPTMISRLADLSFAQLFKDSSDQILSVVFYGQDGKEGFARYIQFSKLPQEVVNSLPEWYMEEAYREKMATVAAVETLQG